MDGIGGGEIAILATVLGCGGSLIPIATLVLLFLIQDRLRKIETLLSSRRSSDTESEEIG